MDQELYQQKIANFIDDASECGRQMFENKELGKQAGVFIEEAENKIKENPIKSVIIGVVSGYIAGKIFS